MRNIKLLMVGFLMMAAIFAQGQCIQQEQCWDNKVDFNDTCDFTDAIVIGISGGISEIPVMDTAELNDIVDPDTAMLVYITDFGGLLGYWNGSEWVPVIYQELYLSGDTIFLSNGAFGSNIIIPHDTLSISSDTLSISNGNSIALPHDTLTLSNDTLTISNGNSVVLPLDGVWEKVGDDIYVDDENSIGINASTPNATLQVNSSGGDILTLSDIDTNYVVFNLEESKGCKVGKMVIMGRDSLGNHYHLVELLGYGSAADSMQGEFALSSNGATYCKIDKWAGTYFDMPVALGSGYPGVLDPLVQISIRGKGNTFGTKALEIHNSTGTAIMAVRDNGQTHLGRLDIGYGGDIGSTGLFVTRQNAGIIASFAEAEPGFGNFSVVQINYDSLAPRYGVPSMQFFGRDTAGADLLMILDGVDGGAGNLDGRMRVFRNGAANFFQVCHETGSYLDGNLSIGTTTAPPNGRLWVHSETGNIASFTGEDKPFIWIASQNPDSSTGIKMVLPSLIATDVFLRAGDNSFVIKHYGEDVLVIDTNHTSNFKNTVTIETKSSNAEGIRYTGYRAPGSSNITDLIFGESGTLLISRTDSVNGNSSFNLNLGANPGMAIDFDDAPNGVSAQLGVNLLTDSVGFSYGYNNQTIFTMKNAGILQLPVLPAFDNDADAAVLQPGDLYQTTGSGSAPLNVAGIIMIKQ